MKISTSYFGETNVGKRGNNEDNLCKVQINRELLLLAVADGMGGAIGGEKASSIAINTLIDTLKNVALNAGSVVLKQLLQRAYFNIQEKIFAEISSNPSLKGMGTTLIAVLVIDGNKIIYSNLGDSRLYQLYRGRLDLLSKDHSYVQEFQDQHPGESTPEFLRNFSNYITRSLDGGKDIPDIYPAQQDFLVLKNGSILLICSDGLILHQRAESQIIKSLLINNKLENAATSLINNAIKRGSTDNISVILYEYGRHDRTSFVRWLFQKSAKSKRGRILIFCILLLFCLLGIIYFGTI